MITNEQSERLNERMKRLRILEQDLDEHFILGSGRGGQKINKTSSCVQLIHAASGIDIRCQKARSQVDNRYWARVELCDKIEARIRGEKLAREQAIKKIIRKNRPASRRAKARRLDNKSKQGDKKKLRGRLKPGDS